MLSVECIGCPLLLLKVTYVLQCHMTEGLGSDDRDRERKADGGSGALWSGESASVPSRVHVLPRIDDNVVFDAGEIHTPSGVTRPCSTVLRPWCWFSADFARSLGIVKEP